MKKIYYYGNPIYGLNELEVKDELYLKGESIEPVLEYIVSDYDIEMRKFAENRWISVYAPYNDEEIYVHDTMFGKHIIMSYNKEKITEWYKEALEEKRKSLNKELEELKKLVEV